MKRLRKIRSLPRIWNILRITVRFRTSPLVMCVNRLYSKYVKIFLKGMFEKGMRENLT